MACPQQRSAKTFVPVGSERQIRLRNQVRVRPGSHREVQVDLAPSPPTNAFDQGSRIQFTLQQNICGPIRDIQLRIKLKCSTAVLTPLPAPYLFNRIECYNVHNQEIFRWYPESHMTALWAMEPKERDRWARKMNVKITPVSNAKQRVWDGTEMSVNEERDYYLPLGCGSFFQYGNVNMYHCRDLRFDLHCTNSPLLSGTATNMTLQGLSFVIMEEVLPSPMADQALQTSQAHDQYMVYLQPVLQRDISKYLQSSATTDYSLENIRGVAAFLVVACRPANSPTAAQQMDYMEWSPEATVDIVSPTGVSLFGRGTAIKEKEVVDMFHHHFPRAQPFAGMYLIPFCYNAQQAFKKGQRDEFFVFTGEKDDLQLVFPAAATAEVHRTTLNAAASAGVYIPTFNGEDGTACAFNATVAVLAAGVDAIPGIKQRKWATTISSQLDSGTTTDCTFDAIPDGSPTILLGDNAVVRWRSTGTPGTGYATIPGAVQTRGAAGFDTPSSNETQANIYAYIYHVARIGKDGVVMSKRWE